MTESGEERRWWWLTQAHKIPMTAALTRVFYPGWAGPGRGRGRGRTARQQPWSSLTRWRWIDLGVRFQVRIKYRMPSFCIHFCAQYLKGKFCAGNFSMVESQAAKMGHDDDRDAAPGSVPPALATSGLLELETSCSNDCLINRQPGGGMKIGRCCHVTPHHIRKVRRG